MPAKRTDAAGSVSDKRFDIGSRHKLGLKVKSAFERSAVDLSVAGSKHQNGAVRSQERHGFGNCAFSGSQFLSSQGNGCTRSGESADTTFQMLSFQSGIGGIK